MATQPRDIANVTAARDALRAVAGHEAVIDAVATTAYFAFITRVVDASGHTMLPVKLAARGPSPAVIILSIVALVTCAIIAAAMVY